MSYHLWLYGYDNPVLNADPSGLQPYCDKRVCGADATDWLLHEMKMHYDYGVQIRNSQRRMKELVLQYLNNRCTPFGQLPVFLGEVATDSPFREIVTKFPFPKTNISIGITPITYQTYDETITSLGVLEYALYGLAVDYSNIRYRSLPIMGSGSCGSCVFTELSPGGVGTNTRESVTICDKCIDSSDIGNVMFGLGGYARGYSLSFTLSSAQGFNILNDVLRPIFDGNFNLVSNPFNGDPLGAIVGWSLASRIPGMDRQSFCTAWEAWELLPYHDNSDQAAQCQACETDWLIPGSTRKLSSLRRVSTGESTINWLMDLLPGY